MIDNAAPRIAPVRAIVLEIDAHGAVQVFAEHTDGSRVMEPNVTPDNADTLAYHAALAAGVKVEVYVTDELTSAPSATVIPADADASG